MSPGSGSGGSPGSLKVPGAVASTTGGLGRIARLLVKDTSRSGEESYRRRTHSLESKNGVPPLRRATSIDSLVDASVVSASSSSHAKTSVLNMTKSNGHLRSYLPVSPALYKRPSFKFDKTSTSTALRRPFLTTPQPRDARSSPHLSLETPVPLHASASRRPFLSTPQPRDACSSPHFSLKTSISCAR
ncbi:hypothetical protein E2C01_026099 [Portunus trituberculatus]|uniref:Uncharacterized protein n=1 Tax=Portunus trituberculatus TaxID=210409 RepID=A0A5B7EEL9_PORTR|nr:hypothetical protein [Portunus trituberculatus]